MLVEMSYHLWHSNMSDFRIRALKGEKRQLQDELIRAKQYITELEGDYEILQNSKAIERS